ncbi:MAG: pyridoxamine 5'-phosphate oxidase family protein [Campylobacteraceae bacterium]|jgi:uncharacterized protein YhbP (UPF0306 family)|nr:pyridoxamine 5'-phosphate oxidase family protein [Campylobacteraceae bacterium]
MGEEFESFIGKHHILNLCTCCDSLSWSSSCFYAFNGNCFIFASDKKTRHMQNIAKNPFVSGTIALETKEVGLIQGLQFEGSVKKASISSKKFYFKIYPFARALFPMLWEIDISYAKLTDNRLGFGKKLEWKIDLQR